MNFRIEGNSLKIERSDGWQTLYTCPEKISHAYCFPMGFVIVLDCLDRNVLLVDHSGALIWRIGEATTNAIVEDGKLAAVGDPFTYLKWENGRLTAQTQAGFQYEVNSSTGELTQTGWIKS